MLRACALLLLTTLATPALASAPQTGATSDCTDAYLDPIVGTMLAREHPTPITARVNVNEGSRYRVTSEGDRVILLFLDATGAYLSRHVGATEGLVPPHATHALICVQHALPQGANAHAYVPGPLTAWTYDDQP